MHNEEKCFTFTWKLENISYCLQRMGAYIKSPAFVVDSIDEFRWYLGLYPRGQEEEAYRNHIGFFLFRDSDSKGAVPQEIKYELSFISKDGSVLTPWKEIKYNFVKTEGYGFPEFISREEVFNTKRSEFLPHDTLRARCRIWKNVGQMAEDVRCFARTRIGVLKRSFLWKVKNFSILETGKIYSYQLKSVARDKLIMSINLSVIERLDFEEIIRFDLNHQEKGTKFSSLQLFLIDASGNKVNCNREKFWFNDKTQAKQLTFFFTKNKLMQMKNSYLPDDVLSLHWEWIFSKGVISNEIEDFQYACANSDCISYYSQNNNQKMMLSYSLSDNLKILYEENFLCDVKLKTKTSIFPAHKIVLCASSLVFKAMFSRDMKEKDSNCISIEDLSDDTICRMLFFMYTARVEEITWETATCLYTAADKYDILSLKCICSSYLKDHLSPNNACDVLLLSDFHADGDLKALVQRYILENVKDSIKSDGWKLLMETNAKLAAETLILQHK